MSPGMIRKSVKRFSEQIMPKRWKLKRDDIIAL
jgi:hypothetical protein